ncbi:pectin lyase-like protein [Thozetella sp. PMI_491]|nr:pectin lyase-like protein [Thozetella sp. PMI_491]
MLALKVLATLALGVLPAAASIDPQGPAKTFALCQSKTCDPLVGCPDGTIYVSQTDKRASFTKIQDAILSIPNNTTPYYILIGPGTYTEQLNVTRRGPLYLLGQTNAPHRGASYAATYDNGTAANEVQVEWSSANHDNTGLIEDNSATQVLTVSPNLNATRTGSGPTGWPVPAGTPFGCTDFRAYNIDFRNLNENAQVSNGPALAVGIGYANAGFYSCGFYSYQDTVFIGKLGNAYMYDSIVAGQTDFLYGFGTLYIEKSTLALRGCGGGVVAWKGSNTTFENKYGAYISDSYLGAANASVASSIAGKCALGRPWNAQIRSIFMETYFDSSILAAGYVKWSTTDPRINNYTLQVVWNNYGPGYNLAAETAAYPITQVLDDQSVQPYRYPVDVFLTPDGVPGNIDWIDQSVLVGR